MPIKSLIRTIPHYPKQGILFRDITTLLKDLVGFRNDLFIVELEARQQPYLFKLRQTKGILKLLQRQFKRED